MRWVPSDCRLYGWEEISRGKSAPRYPPLILRAAIYTPVVVPLYLTRVPRPTEARGGGEGGLDTRTPKPKIQNPKP
jgi:hypothetical protein